MLKSRWEADLVWEGAVLMMERVKFHPRLFTPSTPHSGELDGARTCLLHFLPLIVPSDNVGTSTVPGGETEVPGPCEGVEPSATAHENILGGKDDVSAMAKLLRGVRDSVSGFSPLKRVAGVLCSILENGEAWMFPMSLTHSAYSHPSNQRWISKQ